MTFEQRMAELGVDLSDLPKGYSCDRERAKSLHNTASMWFINDIFGDGISYRNVVSLPLYQYILHLTDVIDRMETRIVNLTGELNYIKQTFMNCVTCTEGSVLHSDRCNSCDENYSNYEFVGVLEGWRPDDD